MCNSRYSHQLTTTVLIMKQQVVRLYNCIKYVKVSHNWLCLAFTVIFSVYGSDKLLDIKIQFTTTLFIGIWYYTVHHDRYKFTSCLINLLQVDHFKRYFYYVLFIGNRQKRIDAINFMNGWFITSLPPTHPPPTHTSTHYISTYVRTTRAIYTCNQTL